MGNECISRTLLEFCQLWAEHFFPKRKFSVCVCVCVCVLEPGFFCVSQICAISRRKLDFRKKSQNARQSQRNRRNVPFRPQNVLGLAAERRFFPFLDNFFPSQPLLSPSDFAPSQLAEWGMSRWGKKSAQNCRIDFFQCEKDVQTTT